MISLGKCHKRDGTSTNGQKNTIPLLEGRKSSAWLANIFIVEASFKLAYASRKWYKRPQNEGIISNHFYSILRTWIF